MYKKIVISLFFFLSFFSILPVLTVEASEPVIIVLDPGHGGENLGAEYNGYTEKDMTMIVANAMYEELSKYENVEIYLTHTDDIDMSLKERAEFAASVNADFLFCLHFNMSPNNNLFGTEVWIPSLGEYYVKGYTFGDIQIKEMQSLGLYSRGIKTKLKEDGISDYYGILRESTILAVPSVLIEHCHLDNEKDKPFYGTDQQLRTFGILDATAVAKYFGLKSTELNVDYSDYTKLDIQTPLNIVAPDMTDPDVCILEEIDLNKDTGEISLKITAQDYDSPLLYYNYSYDGGTSWSPLIEWSEDTTLEFDLTIPSGISPSISVRVYNLFDRFTESGLLIYPPFSYGEDEEESLSTEDQEPFIDAPSEVPIKETKNTLEATIKEFSFLDFLILCFFVFSIIFVIALITKISSTLTKKKGRKRR